MLLKTLISQLDTLQVHGPLDREITSIAYDSRRVKEGTLFVALRGEKTDGHAYIEQAINQGAAAIVTERRGQHARSTTIAVEDSRRALADLAAVFFQNPSQHLKMTGVTGTNGKTTVTF